MCETKWPAREIVSSRLKSPKIIQDDPWVSDNVTHWTMIFVQWCHGTSATSRTTSSSRLPSWLRRPGRRWTEAQPCGKIKWCWNTDQIWFWLRKWLLHSYCIFEETWIRREEVLMGGRKPPGPIWTSWSPRHWHEADTNTGILKSKWWFSM